MGSAGSCRATEVLPGRDSSRGAQGGESLSSRNRTRAEAEELEGRVQLSLTRSCLGDSLGSNVTSSMKLSSLLSLSHSWVLSVLCQGYILNIPQSCAALLEMWLEGS